MRITFATDPATFSVDAESRTIRGLAVPYGGAVAVSDGKRWSFAKGTLDFSRAKVLMDHEGRALGRVAQVEDTEAGASVALKIARGPAGDELLQLADDGVYDGLSIGLGPDVKATQEATGVYRVTSASVREVSSTPFPAFDAARTTSVALSTTSSGNTASKEGTTMADSDVTLDDTSVSGAITGTVTITPDTGSSDAGSGDTSNSDAAALSGDAGPVFSAAEVAQLRSILGTSTGPEPRPVVAAGGARFQVKAPELYRFDGHRGAHEFSTDIFAALRGDRDAHKRVDDFVSAKFAAPVTTGDTAGLNPNRYRPDLYVDSDPVMTPVFDALLKGGLDDPTPFVVPKFSAASGLVDDHTEGAEPDSGDWSATSQTVTPSAVSGEVDITREVIDAGGSPQVSGLIWNEIVKAYQTAMETKAAALLTGSSAAELGTAPAAAAADAVLVGDLTANLATLPFLSYGLNYGTAIYTHIDLYAALVAAKDDASRPLLPILAPANANGTSAERMQSVAIGGYRFIPAPSLGATGANKKSYAFDPSFGGVWASGAQRIALQPTVAYGAKLGVFGYFASAVLSATRVAKITYAKSA